MKLPRRTGVARVWRSFKRHLLLLGQPLFAALVATAAWYQLSQAKIYFPKEDEAVLTTAVVSTLAMAFSILAALVLGSIWKKYQRVRVSVLQKDKDTFLLYRDERIPMLFHLLLASLSLPIVGIVVLLHYQSFWSGVTSTFCTTFAITVYWAVATQLQNPAKSLWFAERIPASWLEVNVDVHFSPQEEVGDDVDWFEVRIDERFRRHGGQ